MITAKEKQAAPKETFVFPAVINEKASGEACFSSGYQVIKYMQIRKEDKHDKNNRKLFAICQNRYTVG